MWFHISAWYYVSFFVRNTLFIASISHTISISQLKIKTDANKWEAWCRISIENFYYTTLDFTFQLTFNLTEK